MRTKKALVFGVMGLVGGFGALLACGSDSYVPDDGGSTTTTTDDDGGGGGGGGDAAHDANAEAGTITGSNCDPTITTGTNACPPSEGLGFFVAAGSKAAGADGTRNNPFPNIQDGINAGKATPAKHFVYVCVGDYKEALTLANGISVFAGWDCANGNWTPVPQHASLHAPSSPAVTGDGLTIGATLDSLDIFAPDGTNASKSSIGIVVTNSVGLKISHCGIQTGAGFDGEDGIDGVQLVAAGNPSGAGNGQGGLVRPNALPNPTNLPSCPGYQPLPSPHCPSNPAAGGTQSCAAPPTSGIDVSSFQPGAGGMGGTGGICVLQTAGCPATSTGLATVCCANGSPANGAPAATTTTTAAGAVSGGANATHGTATNGSNGTNGTAGWNGASFKIADGTAGTNGSPGLGGGGGAGENPVFANMGEAATYTAQGVGGSGGGAGGCPGLAGTPGTAGGASIAVVVFNSTVGLVSDNVKAGNGGRAGKGTFGSASTPGGSGGTFTSLFSPSDGAGASGGSGGMSGWSGNGSAGPSLGIVWHGSAPTLTDTNPQVGNGGAGVDARTQGTKTIPATLKGDALPTTTF